MKLGQFEISSFVEQRFLLDGGSMFGIIPKKIWEKSLPADENNLVPMVTNIFLLRAHNKVLLFDIGLGDTLSEREKKIYGTDGICSLDEGLLSAGISSDDVDYVLLTHLHTDHAGGAVRNVDGKYRPRFPNARYVISKKEWQVAINPNERTAAVYIPERLNALEEAGQVDFIDDDIDLLDGIKLVHTGGHTEGSYAIEIESEDKRVFYYSDIFPTSAHIPVAYVPATDLYPLDSMDVKRKTLPRVVDVETILAFDHDTTTPFGTVHADGRKFIVKGVTASE